jgi:hypothetical protein
MMALWRNDFATGHGERGIHPAWMVWFPGSAGLQTGPDGPSLPI